jgi:histidinol-phosphate aminotransferase
VREALVADGWAIPASEANFCWLPLGEDADDFGRWCTGRGIAVRVFPGEGVRVTIGSAGDNDDFLSAASAWRGRASSPVGALARPTQKRAVK